MLVYRINNDIYNAYLFFLQELIDNKDYSKFKDQFISSKYNLAYMDETIENQMIGNNFTINDLYVSSKFISGLFNITDEIYHAMKDEVSKQNIVDQITSLLLIGDLEYNEKINSTSALIKTCYIRACLLFMSDEIMLDINSQFHEFVESEQYLNEYPTDKISVEAIIRCFKGVKKDKTKVKKISFKIK